MFKLQLFPVPTVCLFTVSWCCIFIISLSTFTVFQSSISISGSKGKT